MQRSLFQSICIGVTIGLGFMGYASAWSLKTHFWIAQQVLNDVLDDGRVELAGNSYEVAPQILNAIRSNPNQFRMGNLGPDVFPDPIVGQMTTHPGVMHGWQTDEWLRQLVSHASSPSEIAFSYGYAAHAAADIFAHSYVNALAGDIFLLTDGEREVERRHFLLEKYIESLTPEPVDWLGNTIDPGSSLDTPAKFLSETLILNAGVAAQNLKAEKSGLHLTAMYEVQNGVRNAKREIQNLIELITRFNADLLKKLAEIQISMATGKLELEAAKMSLVAAEGFLAIKKGITDSAVVALKVAKDLVQNYPGILTYQQNLLSEQLKAAADAANIATQRSVKATEEIRDIQKGINNLRGQIAILACESLVLPWLVNKCKDKIGDLNKEISSLENNISGINAQVAIAKQVAETIKANVDGTKRFIDDIQKKHEEALLGLAQHTYQASIDAASAEQNAQDRVVKSTREIVDELSKIQERVASESNKVTVMIDEVKKVIDNYNGIAFLLDNWIADIDKATDEYIYASHRAGIKILHSNGNPLSEYITWFSCYGSVYTATPIELGEATCIVKNFIEELNNKFDEAISTLPEILQWLVFPSRTAQKKILARLNPELHKAALEIAGFMTDDTTKDFLYLLSDPKNASRERLIKAYREDTSRKNLLRFSDVAIVVDADVALSKGHLNPADFAALNSAVVFAKMSLLQPEALNQLIINNVGINYISPQYGKPVYPNYQGNFSILFGAVRSIDGNQQWQSYALPYARNQSSPEFGPSKYSYGYDYWKSRQMGLKIWVDPYLREKVFLKLFPAGILGSSRTRKDLNWPLYPFPECSFNPFPSTQSAFSGEILPYDRLCTEVSNPNIPASEFQTSSPEEYEALYLNCDTAQAGVKYWTFIASFRTSESAQQYAQNVESRYGDIKTALWPPVRPKGHWGVLLAACTTKDKAIAAMALALRRGIAKDSFYWMGNNTIWSNRVTIDNTRKNPNN